MAAIDRANSLSEITLVVELLDAASLPSSVGLLDGLSALSETLTPLVKLKP